jgi:hypothetical protein
MIVPTAAIGIEFAVAPDAAQAKRRASEVSLGVAERSQRVYFLIGAETRVGTLGICGSGAR